MMTALLRRALFFPVMMIAASLLIFLAIHALPGDPARLMAGPQAPQPAVDALRVRLGLNVPVTTQYLHFLTRAVRGDLGLSLHGADNVTAEITRHLPYSLILGALAYALAIAVGVPAGVLAALRRDTWPDHVMMALTLLGASLASFWVALMGMDVFAARLHWLPLLGAGNWRHYIMPATTLSLLPMALILRMTRAGMIRVLAQDYIRTARAKGLSPAQVAVRHALRNALGPVVTVICLNFGSLLGGAVVTETVFDWPGVGHLLIDAVRYRDYPVIQGVTLLAVMSVLFANLVAEGAILLLDPKARGQ